MSQKLGEAALPHSHCPRGFPGPPLLVLSLLFVLWGPGPWDGGAILDGETIPGVEEQSLQRGGDPWDEEVIPEIRVVILGQIPGTGGSAMESSLPKVGQKHIFWVLPAIRDSHGHTLPLLAWIPKL